MILPSDADLIEEGRLTPDPKTIIICIGFSRAGEKLMSEAVKKLLVADDYFKKFDEELEKVRKLCDSIPDTEQILKELSITEEPSKIREGKHKKKNKSFKNWEHREFWRG